MIEWLIIGLAASITILSKRRIINTKKTLKIWIGKTLVDRVILGETTVEQEQEEEKIDWYNEQLVLMSNYAPFINNHCPEYKWIGIDCDEDNIFSIRLNVETPVQQEPDQKFLNLIEYS